MSDTLEAKKAKIAAYRKAYGAAHAEQTKALAAARAKYTQDRREERLAAKAEREAIKARRKVIGAALRATGGVP